MHIRSTYSTFLIILISVVLNLSCNSKKDNVADGKLSYGITLDKITQSTRTEVLSPEEELAGFTVPEGFVVELVASEADGIMNPIDLTFDDAGRLWTQTAVMYPLDPIKDIQWQDLQRLMNDSEAQKSDPNFKRVLDLYQGRIKGEDKILIISNLYNSGPAQTNVWAEGLAIPQSILPYKEGCYVAQGSEMLYLEDSDRDGKADHRESLLTGFGFTDTHTMAHQLVRGPGDWIHFSHGALNKGEVSSLKSNATLPMNYSKIARFSLDAKKMELVNAGLNNIWGFQLRSSGQWYATEANDLGYSVVPLEKGTSLPGIGGEKIRPYQPWLPELHDFRVGGTGLSSLAFSEDRSGSFPKEWQDVAFLANPITSTINAVKIVRKEDGTVEAEHLPDFLTSKDDWFRPVNMEFGPDGCLYIADWYNKIISHNEVPTSHPDRDKSHGRIWRIRHKSQKPKKVPDFYSVPTPELPAYLESPSFWERQAAWHQISDRPREETLALTKELIALLTDPKAHEETRIMALWSLESLGYYEPNVMKNALKDSGADLKRELIRSLNSFSLSPDELTGYVKQFFRDNNPMIRSQVLRTLGAAEKANPKLIAMLVEACQPELEGNTMGGAYERNFERFLARKGLENFTAELADFLNSPMAEQYPATNRIWASQVLPKAQKEAIFIDLWPKANYKKFNESTLVVIASMISNNRIYELVKEVLANPNNANQHLSYALANVGSLKSDRMANLLAPATEYVLKSGTDSIRDLGLTAAAKFEIKQVHPSIVALIPKITREEAYRLVLQALEISPIENQDIFVGMANNEAFSLNLRAEAINTLSKTDIKQSQQILDGLLQKYKDLEDRMALTKTLSKTETGAELLINAFEKGYVNAEDFDMSSAEYLYRMRKDTKAAKQIYEATVSRAEEEKRQLAERLERYIGMVENTEGDPVAGESLFQACLMCHRVGDKGHDFAPALDGSAARDNEAILTALLDPDAAVESSYSLYRVTLYDESVFEGYLVKRDNHGTTLGFMGGNEKFIPAGDIRSESFLPGRSFMPKGLIDHYSDQQVADLLAYIHSLK